MKVLRFACMAAVWTAVMLAAPGRAAAAHLYAVLVIDPAVGTDADKDREHVEALLKSGIGQQYLTITEEDKEKANKKQLLQYFRGLAPAKEDSVLCFMSCHGGTDRQSGEHVLLLTGGGSQEFVTRAELRDALRATGAHLTILITDACSDYFKLPDRQDVRITFKAPGSDAILPGYQRLFFDAKGMVDINASYEGTFAFSDDEDGGVFTRALYEYFQDAKVRKDATVGWPQLCIAVHQEEENTFGKWKVRVIDQLTKKGIWDPDKHDDDRLLNEQKTQTPQVFFAPGVHLGLQAQGTDGHGVKVINLTLDSPAKAAGIRVGDVIVGVDGQNVKTSDDWDRIIDPALAMGKVSFMFQVVRDGGKMDDVSVSLVP